MAVLVIGLGSMGRRRLRVLKSLGEGKLFVYDVNSDRVNSARLSFDAEFLDVSWALDFPASLELVIVSTPPDKHVEYIDKFARAGIPVFVEASVTELSQLRILAQDSSVDTDLIFPSITLLFFGFTQLLRNMIPEIGHIYLMTYHVGQNVYDWHPWEDPKDYYVSTPDTGACRELVPFELGWIKSVFGDFEIKKSTVVSEGLPELQIASAYSLELTFAKGPRLASILIDVLSRPKPVRTLRLVGSAGTLAFHADQNQVELVTDKSHKFIPLPTGLEDGEGVNPDLPYRSEIEACLLAIRRKDRKLFPNTLFEDIEILEHLELAEALSNES